MAPGGIDHVSVSGPLPSWRVVSDSCPSFRRRSRRGCRLRCPGGRGSLQRPLMGTRTELRGC